jgi:hypothetical protein
MTNIEFIAAAEHAISTGDEKSVRQVVDEAGRARAREVELLEVARQMLSILDMSAGRGKKWEGEFADKCRAALESNKKGT